VTALPLNSHQHAVWHMRSQWQYEYQYDYHYEIEYDYEYQFEVANGYGH